MTEQSVETLRALIVTDNRPVAALLQGILKDLKLLRADCADSLAGADSILNVLGYDALFIDCEITGQDPYAFVSYLRTNSEYNTMAVVLCASEQSQQRAIKALDEGATTYLIKPMTNETVLATLHTLQSWRRSAA